MTGRIVKLASLATVLFRLQIGPLPSGEAGSFLLVFLGSSFFSTTLLHHRDFHNVCRTRIVIASGKSFVTAGSRGREPSPSSELSASLLVDET